MDTAEVTPTIDDSGQRRPPWAPLLRVEVRYILDLLVLSGAYLAALLLRFDSFDQIPKGHLGQLPLVVLIQLSTLWIGGIYNFLWRFIGLAELRTFLQSAALSTFTLLALRLGLPESLQVFRVPISVIVFDAVLAYGGLLAIRIVRRMVYERFEQNLATEEAEPTRPRKRVLLVGAGRAGVMAARELRAQPNGGGFEIVGFLDDAPRKQNTIIHGVQVMGTTRDLARLVEEQSIEEVLLTMVRVSGSKIRNLHQECLDLGIEARIMPGLWEILQGRRDVSRFRKVRIEDVLGREEIRLDDNDLIELVRDRRVLVTGAGGSIGRELARQALLLGPERLILVDRAEPCLFQAACQLESLARGADREGSVKALVADIADEARMRSILWEERPQLILHAAAHKHVPLMETSPTEAVKNNALGTHRLGDLAGQLGVERFVLISTDKAVRPTSIMGASKRLAELFVLDLDRRYDTRYLAVRFGNVLGSTGSVVPIFQEQIERGGPVTVTDPDMVRFFMTIPEASRLVLHAASMGEGGELFVLDMGTPVKIYDLAKDMIRLAGLEPERDVKIDFIGTRPGEKLYEELELGDENLSKTRHPKIFVGRLQAPEPEVLRTTREDLERCCVEGEAEPLRLLLSQLLPEATLDLPSPATTES